MRTKKAPEKSDFKFRFTTRSRDLPATQGILHLVRTELKADVRELRSEMNARFNQMDSKFDQMNSKFSHMDSKFERLFSEFAHVASQVARIGVLVEEQHSNNRVVLEGHAGLWQRQDRLEARVEGVEKLVRSIARSK